MLSLSSNVRIFAARDPVDFRKGFDGLCSIVRDQFADDPFSGHLFLFFNRRHDRVKILVWDRNGFLLLYKRLERGRFERIPATEQRHEIDRAQLAMLLDGIEIRTAKSRRNFSSEVRITTRDAAARTRPA